MADERKYYVLCQSNCKFESMTKEQILTAIAQAVSTGTISDVDAGFITRLVEQNGNNPVKIWVGTQAQYNAITEIDDNTLYITDDTDQLSIILRNVERMQNDVENLEKDITAIVGGGITVKNAEWASGCDEAMHASSADIASSATRATKATSADTASSATKATTATNATGFIARDNTHVDLASNFPYFSTNGGTTFNNTEKPLNLKTARAGLYFLPRYSIFFILVDSTIEGVYFYDKPKWVAMEYDPELGSSVHYRLAEYMLDVDDDFNVRIKKTPYRTDTQVESGCFVVSETPSFLNDYYWYTRICDFTL